MDFYELFSSINQNFEVDIRCVIIQASTKHFSFGLDLKSSAEEIFIGYDLDPARKALRIE